MRKACGAEEASPQEQVGVGEDVWSLAPDEEAQVLWAIGLAVAFLTTALLIVNLPPEMWKGLLEERNLTLIAIGVCLTAIIVLLAIGGASLGWTGFGDKTFWDWLQLLSALAIPVVLAAAGLWFTAQQDTRQQKLEDQRAQQAQKIEDQRAAAERELADQRAQDEALQAYLNQMSSLVLERDLRASKEDSEVGMLARARTLTVLPRLDGERQARVLQFLYETGLIMKDHMVVDLWGADLIEADLRYANLSNAVLSGANLREANLTGANLTGALMEGPNLREANLSNAVLTGADLRFAAANYANLSRAHLYGADLSEADLSHADLSHADLSHAELSDTTVDPDVYGADLSEADLSEADLSDADLSGAEGITNEELEQQAATLEGATMPNGQKYEDWLKSRGEDGENSGPRSDS